MAYFCLYLKNRSIYIVFISITLFSNTVFADDYLKMLEGEAEDVKLDQSGQLKGGEQSTEASADDITRTDWEWEGDLEGDKLPRELAADEFASLLKQHFYGTFVFYRKLNSVDRNTIYYHYTQNVTASLDSVRHDIMNHLKR